MSLAEIIFNFITNFKPAPKCAYSECLTIADVGGPFCALHSCEFENGVNMKKCLNSATEGKSFCVEHSCKETDCDQPRVLDINQLYCDSHACWVCLESGLVAEVALDDPPRNTCENHILCMSHNNYGIICQQLAMPFQTYCHDHKPIRCKAKTRRGTYFCVSNLK